MKNFITGGLKKIFRVGHGKDEVIEFAEPVAESLTAEIATRAASLDFFALSSYLPNPDPVLRKQGGTIKIYSELLTDPRVFAAMQSRKSGVTQQNWQIDQGEAPDATFEFIKTAFAGLDVPRIMTTFLDCVFYGFAPHEIIWDSKTWLPKDVEGKPFHWFQFDQENKLRFRTKSDAILGIELHPHQFITPVHQPSYSNPYGENLASRVFWSVTFKKGSWRFWITFTEKYGMPYLIGRHPAGADQNDINRMADQLEKMVQDAIAVIPEGATVDITQTGTAANAEIFERVIAQANSEISSAILGHEGAGQSTAGKLGNDTGAMDVRQDLIDSDKRIVEGAMNNLIKIIAEVNGISGILPTFTVYEDEDVDLSLAERDDKLKDVLAAAGQKFSKKYLLRSYNLAEDDLEDAPRPTPPSGAAFAEDHGANLEDMLTRMIMFQELSRPNGDGAPAEFAEMVTVLAELQTKSTADVVKAIAEFSRHEPQPITIHVPSGNKDFTFTRDDSGRITGTKGVENGN